MSATAHMPASVTKFEIPFSRMATLLAALALTSLLVLPALAGEDEAQQALARAEAKIEMVTRSGNPPATQSQAFTIAQRKIMEAREALRRDRNKEAEYISMEAEVWAEAAAAMNDLAGMERTRMEMARAVDILAVEVGRQ